DARTFVEEQGVNILFLALGQLKWKDRNAPDKERFAPLILLPVALERKSAAERFTLSWLQEDAAENLSLAAKLKADFGLELPEFKAGDDFDPADYLEQTRARLASQADWEVLPHAMTLGFFSFAKFLMYRDLDASTWPGAQQILAPTQQLPLGYDGSFAALASGDVRWPDMQAQGEGVRAL
ncbi:MAG: DUF4011 domain-containing protein, partial [Comamonas sp.]